MTFRAVELPQRAKQGETQVGVTISRYGLTIGFSPALVSKHGLHKGVAFSLQIGEGESEGLIRIVPDKSGRPVRFLGKGSAYVAFGDLPAFARFGRQDRRYCETEAVQGGGIQIKLPRWKEGGSARNGASGDAHSFTFDLDPDQAESLRDMATEADQEIPDYLAEIIGTYIEEFRKEHAAEE